MIAIKKFPNCWVFCFSSGVAINDFPCLSAFAGDQVVLTVTGPDPSAISVGSVLCDPSQLIRVTSRIEARIVIFNVDIPITKGYPVGNAQPSLEFSGVIHDCN